MSNEPLLDTWHSRDFPVLRECARQLEAAEIGQGVRLQAIVEVTALETDAVMRSLRALEDAGLVEVRWMMPAAAARVVGIDPRARQLVGQWPTEEAALDRIVRALEVIASNAEHPGHEDAATALDAFRHAGDTLQAVADAALTGEMP